MGGAIIMRSVKSMTAEIYIDATSEATWPSSLSSHVRWLGCITHRRSYVNTGTVLTIYPLYASCRAALLLSRAPVFSRSRLLTVFEVAGVR